MPLWNPWRGCRRRSEGCRFCYIHKGDAKRGIDTNLIVKTEGFDAPVRKKKNGEYKMGPGQTVYLCFSSDFFIEDADEWRAECWSMMRERSDLHFLFLTKRIDRFYDCIPPDWGDGYPNVTIGCTVENQETADYRLSIFKDAPIVHRNIICQPLLERITIAPYLDKVELVVVGGESDTNARVLDYSWVLDIREQCTAAKVNFEFRQCGTNFVKDGKHYRLNVGMLCSQARKANIDAHFS
ncbi:MAG TPA: DUF5131 family protein [Treponemataceae bacterium]|nr:DUF5131 family protein [Treponemataceae bacterium]